MQKRNYLLGKVVHHIILMKSERRKDAYSARCKLRLKTFSLSNVDKQAVISYTKSAGHVRNVAEKSGNLIMSGHPVKCGCSVLSEHTVIAVMILQIKSFLCECSLDY